MTWFDSGTVLMLAVPCCAGAEACLLFPTGFAANLGTIAALCGNAHTAIFSDELNHASIVDGCRLAVRQGATLQVATPNPCSAPDPRPVICIPTETLTLVTPYPRQTESVPGPSHPP